MAALPQPQSMPLGRPGPLTEAERFMWDSAGFLIVEDALSEEETAQCLAAAQRVHSNRELLSKLQVEQFGAPSEVEQFNESLGGDLQESWRQIGNAYEYERAFECLIDHPSVFPKARELFGGHLILQGSWLTQVPPEYGKDGGGMHQDGGLVHTMFKPPAPLMQMRIGYVLTDLSDAATGNLWCVPGSHSATVDYPAGVDCRTLPLAIPILARAGSAIMFHQALFHTGGYNDKDYCRYMMHMSEQQRRLGLTVADSDGRPLLRTVYGAPWLARIDRSTTSQAFLDRVTPRQRLLLGEFETSTAPFHSSPFTFHPPDEEAGEGGEAEGGEEKQWDQFLNGAAPTRNRL